MEDRLAALERSNKRLKVLLAVGACAMAMLGANAASQPSAELRTKRIVVVDDKGNTRVSIGTHESGDKSQVMGIRVLDDTGKMVARIEGNKGDGIVAANGKLGFCAITGSPSLVLFDGKRLVTQELDPARGLRTDDAVIPSQNPR